MTMRPVSIKIYFLVDHASSYFSSAEAHNQFSIEGHTPQKECSDGTEGRCTEDANAEAKRGSLRGIDRNITRIPATWASHH